MVQPHTNTGKRIRGGGNPERTSGTGPGGREKTYGQKPYIGDECYDEMVNRSTYTYFLNQFNLRSNTLALTLSANSQVKSPVSTRLGFNNLANFLTPIIENIALRTEDICV